MLGVVFLLAVALRLLAWHFQPFVTYDGTAYIGLAQGLLSGQLAPSVYSPGYPALIASLLWAVRDPVLAATLVSLACGILLVVEVWILARRAVGESWALVPVLAVALHPELVRFSALSMSEATFLAFAYGACVLLERSLVSGLMFGAAYAVRPEGLVLGFLFWIERCIALARRRITGKAFLLFTLGCIAASLVSVAYFRQSLGVWTLTPKIEALRAPTLDWRTDEPRLATAPLTPLPQRLDLSHRLASFGPEILRALPGNAVRVARELTHLWPIPLLALSFWGLVLRRGPESLILFYLMLLPALGLSYQPRFALVVLPALAIAAAVPIARARSGVTRACAAVLLVTGFIWCVANSAGAFTTPFDGELSSAKRAGAWLSSTVPKGTVVMDRKPFLAFYAGGKFRILPDDPYDAVVSEAVRSGVGAIVIEEQLVRTMRPQFAPLVLDPEVMAREPRLELVYIGGEQPNYGLVIFRVIHDGETKSGRRPVLDIVRQP